MPLQNRVTPFGEFIATSARGMLMGNRGGRLHDAQRRLGTRRWRSKQWICCKLKFNNRRRKIWGDSYTEFFFLDEVTAFAAGIQSKADARPHGIDVDVLTPPSILAVLAQGYAPLWHPSAG